MARHKDVIWNLSEGVLDSSTGYRRHDISSIHAALLMDIRDELQKLNRILSCTNFTMIPSILRAIRSNTSKKRRSK